MEWERNLLLPNNLQPFYPSHEKSCKVNPLLLLRRKILSWLLVPEIVDLILLPSVLPRPVDRVETLRTPPWISQTIAPAAIADAVAVAEVMAAPTAAPYPPALSPYIPALPTPPFPAVQGETVSAAAEDAVAAALHPAEPTDRPSPSNWRPPTSPEPNSVPPSSISLTETLRSARRTPKGDRSIHRSVSPTTPALPGVVPQPSEKVGPTSTTPPSKPSRQRRSRSRSARVLPISTREKTPPEPTTHPPVLAVLSPQP